MKINFEIETNTYLINNKEDNNKYFEFLPT